MTTKSASPGSGTSPEADTEDVQDLLGASSSGTQALEGVVDTKTYITMSA